MEFLLGVLSSVIGAGVGAVIAYWFGNKQIKEQIQEQQKISDEEKKFNVLHNARKNLTELLDTLYKNHFYHDNPHFEMEEKQILEGLYHAHMSHNNIFISLINELDIILHYIEDEKESTKELENIRERIFNKSRNYNSITISELLELYKDRNTHPIYFSRELVTLKTFKKDYIKTLEDVMVIILELRKIIK